MVCYYQITWLAVRTRNKNATTMPLQQIACSVSHQKPHINNFISEQSQPPVRRKAFPNSVCVGMLKIHTEETVVENSCGDIHLLVERNL